LQLNIGGRGFLVVSVFCCLIILGNPVEREKARVSLELLLNTKIFSKIAFNMLKDVAPT